MSRGHILVFFNRHCSTMNHMKEKQGGLVPTGLKRWPFKLIKHFADATGVSPSPAGPAGCCPLNFLNLINLKFRVRAPNGCCILLFRPNHVKIVKNCKDRKVLRKDNKLAHLLHQVTYVTASDIRHFATNLQIYESFHISKLIPNNER